MTSFSFLSGDGVSVNESKYSEDIFGISVNKSKPSEDISGISVSSIDDKSVNESNTEDSSDTSDLSREETIGRVSAGAGSGGV